MKIKILSWLLNQANRIGHDQYYYNIKNHILKKYGSIIGYDIQFIEGKKCNSCNGTGIHYRYGWDGRVYDRDFCWHCYNGWYKRPVWNTLARVKFGKYLFHQPIGRVYKKPDNISDLKLIEGYIDHQPAKHSDLALTILFLIYEPGYLKRWYQFIGTGWRVCWWLPQNYLYNLIHIFKHGKNSIPITRLRDKYRKRFLLPDFQAHKIQYLESIDNDLPF